MTEETYTGEIRYWVGKTPPDGWHFCDGSILSVSEYGALYDLIGTTFGSEGNNTFALPNLQGTVVPGAVHESSLSGSGSPASSYQTGQKGGSETNPPPYDLPLPVGPHTHEATFTPLDPVPSNPAKIAASTALASTNSPANGILAKPRQGAQNIKAYALTPTTDSYLGGVLGGGGGGYTQAEVLIASSPGGPADVLPFLVDLRKPYLTVRFIICLEGNLPIDREKSRAQLGDIMLWPSGRGDRLPQGWLPCDGRLMTAHDALYAVLGSSFNPGKKKTPSTVALPDLRGRVPVCITSQKWSATLYRPGDTGGADTVSASLTAPVLEHTHKVIFMPGPQHGRAPLQIRVNNATTGNYVVSPFKSVLAAPIIPPSQAVEAYTASASTPPASLAGVTGQGIGIRGGSVSVEETGQSLEINLDTRQPYVALNYLICVVGSFPSRTSSIDIPQ